MQAMEGRFLGHLEPIEDRIGNAGGAVGQLEADLQDLVEVDRGGRLGERDSIGRIESGQDSVGGQSIDQATGEFRLDSKLVGQFLLGHRLA